MEQAGLRTRQSDRWSRTEDYVLGGCRSTEKVHQDGVLGTNGMSRKKKRDRGNGPGRLLKRNHRRGGNRDLLPDEANDGKEKDLTDGDSTRREARPGLA